MIPLGIIDAALAEYAGRIRIPDKLSGAERAFEALPRLLKTQPGVPQSRRELLGTTASPWATNVDNRELPLRFHAIQSPDLSDGPLHDLAYIQSAPALCHCAALRPIWSVAASSGCAHHRVTSHALNHAVTPQPIPAPRPVPIIDTPHKIFRMFTIAHEPGQKCTFRLTTGIRQTDLSG